MQPKKHPRITRNTRKVLNTTLEARPRFRENRLITRIAVIKFQFDSAGAPAVPVDDAGTGGRAYLSKPNPSRMVAKINAAEKK